MGERKKASLSTPRMDRRRFLGTLAGTGGVLLAPGLFIPAQAQKEVYTVMAAGDISCSPLDSHFNEGRGVGNFCRMADTATLIARGNPDYVLALGDLQYERGTNQEFSDSYDRFWGAFKHITLPVPGNHEYYGNTSTARGFSDAFGIPQEQRQRLYFSKDVGQNWHLVGLNSSRINELKIDPDEEQLNWLKQDLAANRDKHIMAMWHHPRFASVVGVDNSVKAFWEILYQEGAEIVLNGHAHWYERMAKVDPDGNLDIRGIRQFIVGTGGKSIYPGVRTLPFTEAMQSSELGVLKLRLGRGYYSWEYLSIYEDGYKDSGIEILPVAA